MGGQIPTEKHYHSLSVIPKDGLESDRETKPLFGMTQTRI